MRRSGGALVFASILDTDLIIFFRNLLCGLQKRTTISQVFYNIHTKFYALMNFSETKIFYTNKIPDFLFCFIGIFIGFSLELLNFCVFFFCIVFFVWKMSSVVVIIYYATGFLALYVLFSSMQCNERMTI